MVEKNAQEMVMRRVLVMGDLVQWTEDGHGGVTGMHAQ